MMKSAAAVPSAPQTGHCTGAGIRPSTGSMSKAYFCPQPQRIFTGIMIRASWKDTSGCRRPDREKNLSAHSTCTTGSPLCGMGHELIQAWRRFFVKDYSIRIQRLVPADDDEPGVSALGIAAEDGHVLADRLVGAARQPAVVKQADLRIGRVEQFDFHGAFGRQPELGHLALRKRRRLAFHFPVIRPAEYRTQIFVQFRPDGLPTRVIRFVRVCSPNELNVESDLLRVLGPPCQKPRQ